jgi:hypothetical protein
MRMRTVSCLIALSSSHFLNLSVRVRNQNIRIISIVQWHNIHAKFHGTPPSYCLVIIRSLHDLHEMNAYRADHVCLSFCFYLTVTYSRPVVEDRDKTWHFSDPRRCGLHTESVTMRGLQTRIVQESPTIIIILGTFNDAVQLHWFYSVKRDIRQDLRFSRR